MKTYTEFVSENPGKIFYEWDAGYRLVNGVEEQCLECRTYKNTEDMNRDTDDGLGIHIASELVLAWDE